MIAYLKRHGKDADTRNLNVLFTNDPSKLGIEIKVGRWELPLQSREETKRF